MSAPMDGKAALEKPHHFRLELCKTRPKYREGRRLKAVKAYTVSQESKYLLVLGVPAINTQEELRQLLLGYGEIELYHKLENYQREEFTEVFKVKFKKIKSARLAKRKLDDHSFYGGVLHVCYAPEFESTEDTREKLQERRMSVARRIRELENGESRFGEHRSGTSIVFHGSQGDNQYSLHGYPSADTHPVSHSQLTQGHNQPTLQQQLIAGVGQASLSTPLKKASSANTSMSKKDSSGYRQGADHIGLTYVTNELQGKDSKVQVRQYNIKGKTTPRFVPRQIKKRDTFKFTDNVNAQLKRDALCLGDTTGPMLPEEEEVKRKRFKDSITGETSLDQTVLSIRNRLSRVKEVK